MSDDKALRGDGKRHGTQMENENAASRGAGVKEGRCPICDWPFAASENEGCVPGNCSYRPDRDSPEGRRITERRATLRAEDEKPKVEQPPPPLPPEPFLKS